MIPPAWIGFAAAFCTTFSLFPQVIRIWRTKQSESISIPAFAIFFTGVSLWLVYGLNIGDWPLIISNSITVILSGAIVGLSWRYRKRN